MKTKGLFHFEIIINILGGFFRFIWIPTCCRYTAIINSLILSARGGGEGRLYTSEYDVYRRQILTYKKVPRTVRVTFSFYTMNHHPIPIYWNGNNTHSRRIVVRISHAGYDAKVNINWISPALPAPGRVSREVNYLKSR